MSPNEAGGGTVMERFGLVGLVFRFVRLLFAVLNPGFHMC